MVVTGETLVNTGKSQVSEMEIYHDGTYFQKNSTWHVEDSPFKARQILKAFARSDIKPETVCEIGCGAGEILKQMEQVLPDTHFFGYELSIQAYQMCIARSSARVSYFNSDVLAEDKSFDVMLCIDVFEHVDDYIGFLRNLRSKSKLVVFHIPLDMTTQGVLRNLPMKARQSVGHLHYFSEETAIATLEYAGYKIIDSFFTAKFIERPEATLKARLALIPRRILYYLSPRFAVKLLGGCSLMVVAETNA